MADQMAMLKNSQSVDAKLKENGELDRAVSALADSGNTKNVGVDSRSSDSAKATTPAGQDAANKSFANTLDASVHPFGYNENNRLVAERVVRDEKRMGVTKQTQAPKTPGEASSDDLAKADAFEEANPEVLDTDTVVEEHASTAQRSEILADRAAQLASAKASAPPPPPAPVSDGMGQGTETKPLAGGFAPPPPPAA